MEKNLKEQLKAIYEKVKCSKTRSCWSRGVRESALTILDDAVTMLDDTASRIEKWADLEELLLNGANNWPQFSYDGNALIYDVQIAAAFCTPSELIKKDYGRLGPNSREIWMDVQARALYQSAWLIRDAFAKLTQCYK